MIAELPTGQHCIAPLQLVKSYFWRIWFSRVITSSCWVQTQQNGRWCLFNWP